MGCKSDGGNDDTAIILGAIAAMTFYLNMVITMARRRKKKRRKKRRKRFLYSDDESSQTSSNDLPSILSDMLSRGVLVKLICFGIAYDHRNSDNNGIMGVIDKLKNEETLFGDKSASIILKDADSLQTYLNQTGDSLLAEAHSKLKHFLTHDNEDGSEDVSKMFDGLLSPNLIVYDSVDDNEYMLSMEEKKSTPTYKKIVDEESLVRDIFKDPKKNRKLTAISSKTSSGTERASCRVLQFRCLGHVVEDAIKHIDSSKDVFIIIKMRLVRLLSKSKLQPEEFWSSLMSIPEIRKYRFCNAEYENCKTEEILDGADNRMSMNTIIDDDSNVENESNSLDDSEFEFGPSFNFNNEVN